MWQSTRRDWDLQAGQLARGATTAHDRRRRFLLGKPARPRETDLEKSSEQRSAKMARLEAVLLVADTALSARRIAQLATLASTSETRQLVDQLNTAYVNSKSAFQIEQVATGFQLLTRPEFSLWLDRLHNRQSRLKLSTPALETLSIVAYRQPITRADVESIRGVQSTEILRHLLERGLIRIAGEDDSLGRPYLYETTRRFLEIFGLRDLDDLPNAEWLTTVEEPVADVAADTGEGSSESAKELSPEAEASEGELADSDEWAEDEEPERAERDSGF